MLTAHISFDGISFVFRSIFLKETHKEEKNRKMKITCSSSLKYLCHRGFALHYRDIVYSCTISHLDKKNHKVFISACFGFSHCIWIDRILVNLMNLLAWLFLFFMSVWVYNGLVKYFHFGTDADSLSPSKASKITEDGSWLEMPAIDPL